MKHSQSPAQTQQANFTPHLEIDPMLDAQPHLHPTAVIDLLHVQRDLGVEQLGQALHISQHSLLERPELLNRGLGKYGELPAVVLVG